MRSVDLQCFVRPLGTLTDSEIQEIAAAIAIVVEYFPEGGYDEEK